jgi:ParB family transcriptional regulator, chromosome partitioning protein
VKSGKSISRAPLKIEYLDPGTLKPNPWNTNVCSPEAEAKIQVSLDRFGAFKPILVRTLAGGVLEIIGGEHRALVAQRMGMETVPVVNLGPISDNEAKEIGLVDNGRYGADDTLGLAKLLEELGDTDDLRSFLPYSDTELENIFASTHIDLDALDAGPELEISETPASSAKPVQTHQTMKFRVRVEDAESISREIERVMREQGFTKDVAEVNAGDALSWLIKKATS